VLKGEIKALATIKNLNVCTGPANIFGEIIHCKKWADLHPRQGN
jgi:hypothetical protein